MEVTKRGGLVVLLALGCLCYGTMAARAQDWRPYKDPTYHFQMERPAGWEVKADGRHILVQSPDHGSFALIENFVPQNDETAEDHVDDLPKTDGAVLRGAVVREAFTLTSPKGAKGEQAVGTLSYQGERGPSKAVALCQVFPKGGLLFALGATNDRFASERPILLRVLQSLRFEATASPRNSHDHAAPAFVDSLGGVQYAHWSDPKENAFSVDVPQGWKRDGGTFRANVLDSRQAIQVRSPHDEMVVMLGDSGVPHFTLPDAFTQRQGVAEGGTLQPNGIYSMVMHYLPGVEFNRWYLTHFLGKSVESLEVTQETDQPELAAKMNANAPKTVGPAHYVLNIGDTEFTCRDKKTGSRISGIIRSITSLLIGNAQGQGNWIARPTIYAWADGDSKADSRKQAVLAVYQHMNQTFKMNMAWAASENKRQQAFVAANAKAIQQTIAARRAAAQRSATMARANTKSSDDRRQALLGSFQARMRAKDENTRHVVNYALDQTDVADGSGGNWKVASGYNNYYRNGKTGTIVGTNSPYSPGVDFTPLMEH